MTDPLITFRKAGPADGAILLGWLDEPRVRKFWDLSDEGRANMLNYLEGTKNIFDYWIGDINGAAFCQVMTTDARDGEPRHLTPFIPPHGDQYESDPCVRESGLSQGLRICPGERPARRGTAHPYVPDALGNRIGIAHGGLVRGTVINSIVIAGAPTFAPEEVFTTAPVGTEIVADTNERPCAVEHRYQTLVDVARRYRLGEKLVNAGVTGGRNMRFVRMPREHDDGNVGVGAVRGGADLNDKIHTTVRRHFPIDKKQVDGTKRKFAVGGVDRASVIHRADAYGAQDARQQCPHIDFVVDDENVQLIDTHDCHGRATFFGQAFKN